MNKKLILRVLCIFGGLLVILSLFLPYVKVLGFSRSLWETYIENKQIYLAIVIMLFGILPIILSLINKKVEFSLMSVGALGFFLIIQIIDTVSGGTFKTLNIGFYCLLIGTLLITVSTLILSKNSKVNILEEQISPISNNISNPIQRNGLDPILNETQISSNQSIIQNDDVTAQKNGIEPLNDNQAIEPLAEEIPEYNPEKGINPVVSEFTEFNNSVVQNEQLNNIPNETIQQNIGNSYTPIMNQNNINVQQQSNEANQAELVFEQQSYPSTQQTDIQNTMGQSQVDIFGQPK